MAQPKDKAAAGLALVRDAVQECVEDHPDGINAADTARNLGLEGNPERFTRTVVSEVLKSLEAEGKIRSEKRGRGRLFFPSPCQA